MQLKAKTLGIVAACVATLALAAPAYAVSYECDNDTKTYSNTGSETSYWAHHTDSGNYGDYRISSYTGSHHYYHWVIPTGTTSSQSPNWTLQVYLNNPNFNNTAVKYFFDGSNIMADKSVTTFNQNNALAGWNTVDSGHDWGTIDVSLDSYNYANPGIGETGADTIYIYY